MAKSKPPSRSSVVLPAGNRPQAQALAHAIAGAVSAYQRGAWQETERLCRAVLAAKPDHFDALHLLGIVAAQSGQPQEAADLLARAASANPRSAEVHNNLGNALRDLGRHADALSCFERAVARNPAFAEVHYNRGNTLYQLKRPAEALQCYERALALAPGYADAFNNRGNALRDLKRYDEALESYARAIALQPDSADAWSNRGHVLRGQKRYDEAIASYGQAVALAPDYAAAHFDLALCRLLLGDFATGWAGYEWRWKKPEHRALRRNFAPPLWNGAEPLAGRTILLYAEQGLGDTLQFCRYASLVAARGATVVLEVPPPLLPLLSGLEGVAQVLAAGSPLPAFDCHCPLMSLPLAFGTDLSSIPSRVPYLASDPARVARWRSALGPRDAPRIGLVWAGSLLLEADNRSHRSLALAEMLPLAGDGVQWVSLQKEVSATDAALLASRPDIRSAGGLLTDFAETAALVELMDVVVTVDTSVAHLAGAMGKPVWILLEWSADWRWLRDRDDSPWYPTARLFRQAAPGDWAGVIRRVRDALDAPGVLRGASAPA